MGNTAASRPEQSAPTPTPGAQPDGRDPSKLLKGAAGISAAELQMHRDTWAFLVEHAAGDRHFHVPGVVEERDGFVTVHVSGPSIVAVLTSLDRVSRTGEVVAELHTQDPTRPDYDWSHGWAERLQAWQAR
ncbi:hypothetical protein ABT186_47295, partial [Streptomyces sp. NPDC001634]